MKKIESFLNIVIAHSYNSDTNNLRASIWDACDKLNIPRFMPELQPIRTDANFSDWSKIMDVYRTQLSRNLYFNEHTMAIGHSLGNLFLIKYIAQNNIRIDTFVSLAGFFGKIHNRPDIDEIVKDFLPTDEEIEKFKQLVPNRIAIYDLNDMLLNPEAVRTGGPSLMEEFAEKLGAKKVPVTEGGHFGKGTGTTIIPALNAEIANYEARKRQELIDRYVSMAKAKELFGDWSKTICVHKNGFDLYIPQGNTDDIGYFYVNSIKGHDCYATDSGSTHVYTVLSGEGEFIINDVTFPVKAHSVVVIHPNDTFYYKGTMGLLERIIPNFKEENFHVLQTVSYEEPVIENTTGGIAK